MSNPPPGSPYNVDLAREHIASWLQVIRPSPQQTQEDAVALLQVAREVLGSQDGFAVGEVTETSFVVHETVTVASQESQRQGLKVRYDHRHWRLQWVNGRLHLGEGLEVALAYNAAGRRFEGQEPGRPEPTDGLVYLVDAIVEQFRKSHARSRQ